MPQQSSWIDFFSFSSADAFSFFPAVFIGESASLPGAFSSTGADYGGGFEDVSLSSEALSSTFGLSSLEVGESLHMTNVSYSYQSKGA